MYYREENKLQFVNTEFCMSLARAHSSCLCLPLNSYNIRTNRDIY